METLKPALLALGMTAALAVGAQSSEMPMEPSGAIQAMQSNSEKDFYETAASTDMLEIAASKLALTMSDNAQIKAFAQRMIDEHTRASMELKKLASSKNVALPTVMLERHSEMVEELKDEETPKEFNEAYKRVMTASHKEAVSLFDQTAKKAKDPEVKAFASKMLPKLQAHGGHAKDLPKS